MRALRSPKGPSRNHPCSDAVSLGVTQHAPLRPNACLERPARSNATSESQAARLRRSARRPGWAAHRARRHDSLLGISWKPALPNVTTQSVCPTRDTTNCPGICRGARESSAIHLERTSGPRDELGKEKWMRAALTLEHEFQGTPRPVPPPSSTTHFSLAGDAQRRVEATE
jgi:hypothetical protein